MVLGLGIEPSYPLYERGASPQCFPSTVARAFSASVRYPSETTVTATSSAARPGGSSVNEALARIAQGA